MTGGLAELLRRPRYEIFPLPGIEDELAEHVPTDVKVTVTSSPRRGLEPTLQLCSAAAEPRLRRRPARRCAPRDRRGAPAGDRRPAARDRRARAVRHRRRRRGTRGDVRGSGRRARRGGSARAPLRRSRHLGLPREPSVHSRRDDDPGDVRQGSASRPTSSASSASTPGTIAWWIARGARSRRRAPDPRRDPRRHAEAEAAADRDEDRSRGVAALRAGAGEHHGPPAAQRKRGPRRPTHRALRRSQSGSPASTCTPSTSSPTTERWRQTTLERVA